MQLNPEFLKAVSDYFPVDFLSQVPVDLQTYGKDWTKVYSPAPSAVVFPRSTDDVVRFVQFCTKYSVPIVPSGGRTGLAGGAMAAHGEVVLSFYRMNQMGAVDPLAQLVRVQAGTVTEAVHQHAAQDGLTWPVDFSSKGSSQVGGNVSTNAGGVRVIHYGMTRHWVLGLQIVTMAGEVLELNGALEKNNTGTDLRQLFIGSEGTLGIVTEATLKLARLPGVLDLFFFAVEDMRAVLKLFQVARRAPFTIMAFETLTHNCLEITVQHLGLKSPFQQSFGAYVLLEVERPASPDAQNILDHWLEVLFKKKLVQDGILAQSSREAKELWKIREGIGESLFLGGFVHKNDIALPITELEQFVSEMCEMFQRQYVGFEVYLFGHIGDGNLHVNTMKPSTMDQKDFLQLCQKADEDLFSLVQRHHGSISAEHGIGLLKKASLRFSRSPTELEYMKSIKKIWDPNGLLNPGKVL